MLEEPKLITFFLCNTENPCLPLPKNWILRVEPAMQIELLRTTADFGLTDEDKINVINKYLVDNSPDEVLDVLERYANALPAVEDMASLR